MGTEIGTVSINLRMSLAQFRKDVSDGNADANKAARDMKDTFRDSSREATGSLALIGEELGIRIPRHLRTFITAIPGVGAALSAAFSSVAVLALIEVIVKVVEKIQSFRDHLAESAAAWDKTNQQGLDAIHSLDTQLLALQVRIDEITGNHVKALQDQLKLIDMQTLRTISDEFTKFGASVDDAFKKMQTGWAMSMLGFGNDKGVKMVADEFQAMMTQVQELANAGDKNAIGGVIDKEIARVKNSLAQIATFNDGAVDGTNAIVAVLQKELASLNTLATLYAKTNEEGSKKDIIATKQAENAETERDIALEKQKQQALDFARNSALNGRTVSKYGNPYNLPMPSGDPTGLLASPNFGNAGQTPLYGGSKEAKDQLNLLSDQNEQLKQASELYSATRTESERYSNELQALNTLLQTGAIDQNTYNRAVTEAKAKYDAVAQGLTHIGQTIGQDIAQAALYGGSWVKAFQDIAAEIVKVVIQMTILKSLQNASAASGGGGFLGFFTSIFSGLTARASGGPVYQGDGYLVGEHGPEFFSPTTSGQIIPNGQMGGGGPQVVNHYNEFNFNGVADMDSFRQSQSQVAAAMAAQLSRHAQRNG